VTAEVLAEAAEDWSSEGRLVGVTCREAGCGRPVNRVTMQQLCGTHYQRRWRWGRPPLLPVGVLAREAYPYREWLPSVRQVNNVVHCPSRVLVLADGDGEGDDVGDWLSAPLCAPETELRPRAGSGFRMPPRACKRCESVLRRVGLLP
jgi:hypothetical protein